MHIKNALNLGNQKFSKKKKKKSQLFKCICNHCLLTIIDLEVKEMSTFQG